MKPTSNSSAIYNRADYGPTFGGGHDLHLSNKCNENNSSYANFPHTYNCNGIYQANQQTKTSFTGAINGHSFKVT